MKHFTPHSKVLSATFVRAARRVAQKQYVCRQCTRRLMHHRAYIALGSNVGDRIPNIEAACRALENGGIKILKTSSLFQTKAMYVEDQPDFLNGACEVLGDLLFSRVIMKRGHVR